MILLLLLLVSCPSFLPMAHKSDIVFWNSNGLSPSRRSALSVFLHNSSCLGVAVCETKFAANAPVPKFPGYISYSKPYKKGSAGLAFFLRSSVNGASIPQKRCEPLELSPHSLFVQCHLPSFDLPIVVGVLYHHRTSSSTAGPNWQLLLSSIVQSLSLGVPVILLGDFNCHHPSWDARRSDSFGASLDSFALTHSLSNLNSIFCPNVPTFPRSGSVIDLCLVSDPSSISDFRPVSSIPLMSDHTPIVASLALSEAVPPLDIPHSRLDLENADWGAFSSALSLWSPTALADVKLLAANNSSPQAAVNAMNSLVLSMFCDAASLSVPSKLVGPLRKHWWTAAPGVTEALYAYRRARRRFSHRKSPAAKAACAAARKEWNRVSTAAKQASWSNLCAKIEDPANRRLLWPFWKKTKPSDSAALASISAPGLPLPTSLTESLNNLASHYAAVSAGPGAPAPSSFDKRITNFVHSSKVVNSSMSSLDRDFSDSDLSAVCDHLTKSAFFSDSVSPLFLRNSPAQFRLVVLFVLNYSWRFGVLPVQWKQADVFPIFKGKGSPPSVPKSYRPISLTCSLVKLLERLILHRLIPFLEDRSFFNKFQAGFRRDHSTLDQLYRLVDRIQTALESRHYVSVVFLDIVAAFDSVWHEGLLFKLFRAGVHGRSWRWISAFLSGRQLRVTHSNCKSDWFPVNAGVPQGSILGPILFLIFINDLPCASSVSPAIFADDIALWPRLDGCRGDAQLNKVLEAINAWAHKWHVVFSPTKSVSVCFNRKRFEPHPLPLSLGSFSLPRAAEINYLGLLFHESLSWSPHCNRVISSSFLAARNVSRVIHSSGPSPAVIRQLVLSTVVPVASYAFPIWSPPSQLLWNKLNAAISLPLRVCLGLPPSVHRSSLFSEFGVFDMRLLHHVFAVSFARRCFLLPYNHPSHELMLLRRRQRRSNPTPFARSRVPFCVVLERSEAVLKLKHHSSTKSGLHRAALAHQHDELNASAYGALFQSVKRSPGISQYIRCELRPAARNRARLRLDRVRLNVVLHRQGAVPSPNCSTCVAESVSCLRCWSCCLPARPVSPWCLVLSPSGSWLCRWSPSVCCEINAQSNFVHSICSRHSSVLTLFWHVFSCPPLSSRRLAVFATLYYYVLVVKASSSLVAVF